MPSLIQRPRFFEGQVLGADDLGAALEYSRDQQARHGRLVHEWGIADGLALVTTPSSASGSQPVVVTLTAGMAIDGTGREIVVPAGVTLDEKVFLRSNVAVSDPDTWYPVLLAGADSPALPLPVSHSCSVPGASRTVESYRVSFGAVGDEAHLDEQAVPRVDEGPAGAPNQPRWWILIGFVKWDASTRRFTGVANQNNGIGRRYVRVRADEVTSQGGRLALRSRRAGAADAPILAIDRTELAGRLTLGVDDGHGGVTPKVVEYTDGTIESDAGQLVFRSGAPKVDGKPMLRLGETPAGGTLTFGLQDAGGQPSNLLDVDERGNLTIAGVFHGLFGGAIRVASGTATDGVILPLPDGITEEQVANDEVELHIQLNPRPPGRVPYDADLGNVQTWIGTPLSTAVDADRRLLCRIQWVGFMNAGGPPSVETLSGASDYVVLAVVKGSGA